MKKTSNFFMVVYFCLLLSGKGDCSQVDARKSSGGAFQRLDAYRAQLHQWDRVVRGFRFAHNFSLGISNRKKRWKMSGAISHDNVDNLYSSTYATEATMVIFSYSFHLPISDSFGYQLGSSIGVSLSEASVDKEMETERTLELPGVIVGFVWNVSPALRLSVALDGHLLRVEKLTEAHSGSDLPKSVVYMNGVGFHPEIAAEFFYRIGSALKLAYVYSFEQFTSPDGSEGSPIGVSRSNQGKGLLIGVTHHII